VDEQQQLASRCAPENVDERSPPASLYVAGESRCALQLALQAHNHPQHAAMDDNLMDDVSELLHSTPLERVLLLQHVVTHDNLMDDVSELLHSTCL
jgi:hypothetical protein